MGCPRQTHPSNVAAGGPDAAHGHPDSPRGLGDERAVLQCVVDALDAVVLHAQEEAAGGEEKADFQSPVRQGRLQTQAEP